MTQLEFDFDAAGNRTALRAAIHNGSSYDDDLENTYTYDALHRLTRLDQAGQSGGNVVAEKRVDFAYNATGQFTDIDRFKDLDGGSTHHVVETDFVYDGLGRLTDLTHTHDTTTIADYGWTFDSYSRVTQMSFTSSIGNSGTSDYSYDDTGQVTAADHDFQTDESYSYDENGNRTLTGYTTGDNNQLTSDGTFNYTYDDEGNRLTRTRISGTADDYTTEYEWDHDNRLTKLTYKNNSGTITKEIEYGYDLFGRRISKTIDWDGAGGGSAEEVHYVYDGDDILLAFDGDGDLTNRYLHGPAVDQILADEQVTSLTSAGDVLWPLVGQSRQRPRHRRFHRSGGKPHHLRLLRQRHQRDRRHRRSHLRLHRPRSRRGKRPAVQPGSLLRCDRRSLDQRGSDRVRGGGFEPGQIRWELRHWSPGPVGTCARPRGCRRRSLSSHRRRLWLWLRMGMRASSTRNSRK